MSDREKADARREVTSAEAMINHAGDRIRKLEDMLFRSGYAVPHHLKVNARAVRELLDCVEKITHDLQRSI